MRGIGGRYGLGFSSVREFMEGRGNFFQEGYFLGGLPAFFFLEFFSPLVYTLVLSYCMIYTYIYFLA